MLSPQVITLLTHVAQWLGLAAGGGWAVKASAKHVCWMIVCLVILFKTGKTDGLPPL